MQRKANGLLQYLHEHAGDTMKWNKRGHILVEGQVIENSHIVDLVRHAVCPKTVRVPIGADMFYKALKIVDTPAALVANSCYTDSTKCEFKQEEDILYRNELKGHLLVIHHQNKKKARRKSSG